MAGVIKTTDISVTAREIDFVTRFGSNWQALMDILGIMRPIEKQAGTKLVASKVNLTLEDGSVAEGADIPYSHATIVPVLYEDLDIKKWAKAVSIEAVNKYGANVAVQKTDSQFLTELQNEVMTDFYNFIKTGTLRGAYPSFQMAVSMAIGLVVDKFKSMHKDVTDINVFVNTLDVYEYLGSANITIQTTNGIRYVENFLGAKTLILSSEIARGTVIAVPSDNIDLYYINPANSDFAELGLNYTVDGDTNLIGFHANGNYGTAVGEMFAIMGMKLWAEYLDGIAVVDIDDSTVTDLTVSADDSADYFGSGKGADDIQSNIAVVGDKVTGTLKFIPGGIAPGTLSGDGYFIGLKFSNFASGLTYANVQVGLVNSASGMGLQTLDSDKNAVFKIADKDSQKVKIVQTTADGKRNVQYLDLSGLTLESTGA